MLKKEGHKCGYFIDNDLNCLYLFLKLCNKYQKSVNYF